MQTILLGRHTAGPSLALPETRGARDWLVFNQSAKRVALFDFSQRKAAEAKAGELTSAGKNQHFVMKVKEAIAE
jgi:hypothetical protein